MNWSSIRSGSMAGSIAVVVGSLVQLPLNSPSDTLFNAGSVMAAGLPAGVVAGLLWGLARNRPTARLLFFVLWLVVFGLVVAGAAVGRTELDRFVSYLAPLAAIMLGLIAVLTPWLTRYPGLTRWAVFPLFAVAVGMGLGLAGLGDQASGRLELPPRTFTQQVSNVA